MTPIYGDITLINGRINNLLTEVGATLPTFVTTDAGRIFFNNSNGTLAVNDGNEWVILQFSNTTDSSPLLTTLGRNWINVDLSFDPTPFNALNNIKGLNANDNLFSVFEKLDQAITGLSSQNLENLGDVSFGSLNAGDIIYWSGTKFSNISMDNLASARLSLKTTSLKDVTANNYESGDILIFSKNQSALVNKQVMFTFTSTATDNAFAINHNLGIKFPFVQIINYATNTSITSGYTVYYTDNNNLTVVLTTASPVIILIMGINNS